MVYLELPQIVAQDTTQRFHQLVGQAELGKVEHSKLREVLQGVHYSSRCNGHLVHIVVDLLRTQTKCGESRKM